VTFDPEMQLRTYNFQKSFSTTTKHINRFDEQNNMRLHHLLTDRIAIRILKLLYDLETQKKGVYTMKLSDAKISLKLNSSPENSITILSTMGLIGVDAVNGDHIMSITNKGKEFIEIFDQLIELFLAKDQKGKKVSVKYELTAQEKRILVLTYRISKEIGRDFVALKTLVEELYPNQDNKTGAVSRYISRLEEIKLMERKKEGRNSYVKVTDKGFRTIREQYLNGLMH